MMGRVLNRRARPWVGHALCALVYVPLMCVGLYVLGQLFLDVLIEPSFLAFSHRLTG